MMQVMTNGIILLNKPAAMTSFQAVGKIRRLLHAQKGGHTGTLDPQATGLMIVLLGAYTKLVPFVLADHKRYHAEFRFGLRTDTQDIFGTIIEEHTPRPISIAELEAAASTLRGKIKQIPPMYSAVHVQGKKLYELARQGKEVERRPREVEVYALSVYPLADGRYGMDAEVSSGTYIRTLIYDLGVALHEDALMTSLCRTGIGSVSLQDAQTFAEIESGTPRFCPPEQILDPLWQIKEAPASILRMVENGMTVDLEETKPHVILTHAGQLLAAYEKREDRHYHCVRGLRG